MIEKNYNVCEYCDEELGRDDIYYLPTDEMVCEECFYDWGGKDD